ncbi:MAG: Gar1/Naf1 family protein [Candidatus Bathyarchaeia archaeon]
MKEAGEILHVIKGNKVVAKVKFPLKLGLTVYDIRRKPIGQIIDIFGPVKSPYVEIDVGEQDPKKLVNSPIYILPKAKNVKGSDKNERR